MSDRVHLFVSVMSVTTDHIKVDVPSAEDLVYQMLITAKNVQYKRKMYELFIIKFIIINFSAIFSYWYSVMDVLRLLIWVVQRLTCFMKGRNTDSKRDSYNI